MTRTRSVYAAAVLATVAVPFVANNYWLYVLSLILVYALAGLGLTVLTGWTGQIALAHAGFMGIGAYATVLLAQNGVPWVAALLASVLICGVAGLLVGLPAVRLRGLYLAIATLAFGELVVQIGFDWTSVTGGTAGKSVNSFQLFGLPAGPSMFYIAAALTAAVFVVVCRAGRRRFGRRLKVVRDMPVLSGSLGISAVSTKLMAFALSAAIAGLAGGLFGQILGFLTPSTFDVPLMVQLLVITFAGGITLARGAVLGALLVVLLNQELQNLGSTQILVYSLLLLMILLVLPAGLGSAGPRIVGRLPFRVGGRTSQAPGPTSPRRAPAIQPAPPPDTPGPVLSVAGLRVSFGGNLVLDHVDLVVEPGFTGLLGPNGAGKTTLINAITGYVPARADSLQLLSSDLRDRKPVDVARLGVARTFQTPRIVGDLTVIDNVLVGAESSGSRLGRQQATAAVKDLLCRFGLEDLAHVPAASVPLAMLKLVELLRAISSDPKLLLLDEPAAGLTVDEVEGLIQPLQTFVAERHTAVVIIEHDLDLISRLCDRAYVLNFGSILASGTPDEVLTRPDVVSAYLGAGFDAFG